MRAPSVQRDGGGVGGIISQDGMEFKSRYARAMEINDFSNDNERAG